MIFWIKIRQVGWKKLIPLRFFFGLDRMEKTKPHTHSWNKSKGWQGIGCHVLTKDLFLNFWVFFLQKKIFQELFFELFELLNFFLYVKKWIVNGKSSKVQKFKKFRFHFLNFFWWKKSKSSGVKSSKSKCLSSECFGLTSQKQKHTHTLKQSNKCRNQKINHKINLQIFSCNIPT